MIVRTFIMAMGFAGTITTSALAQPLIDILADKLARKSNAPGVVVAYTQPGEQGLAVRGVRRADSDETITENDLWHIGSLTKSMTATLVARLADKGQIAWSDTVGGVLGAEILGIPPEIAAMSYAELLDHRSRIVANIPHEVAASLAGRLEDRDMMADRLTYARAALAAGLVKPTKSGFSYSNAGYVIAGTMMQQTTGQTWEKLLRQEVFTPLGMDSAGFGAPGNPDTTDQPWGHQVPLLGRKRPIPPVPEADNIPAMGPAGTVHLSASDMMTYLTVHMRRDSGFLSADSWMRLHIPHDNADYVSGWLLDDKGIMTHAGSNTLWFAWLRVDPAAQNALLMMLNSGETMRIGYAVKSVESTFVEALPK